MQTFFSEYFNTILINHYLLYFYFRIHHQDQPLDNIFKWNTGWNQKDGHNCGIYTFLYLYNCCLSQFVDSLHLHLTSNPNTLSLSEITFFELRKIRQGMLITFLCYSNWFRKRSLEKTFHEMCRVYNNSLPDEEYEYEVDILGKLQNGHVSTLYSSVMDYQ